MRSGLLRYNNFTGGEASKFPVLAMHPKYSVRLQNCHVSDRGGIAKIPGYTAVNSASAGVELKSGFEFRKANGTAENLTAGGGKIFKGSAMSEIKTGLNASAKCYFSSMNDLCVITNGVDTPMKYGGSSVSALGGNPPATTFKTHVHKGRMWFLERNNKALASHSALNNPESQEGYIDFRSILGEGDELLDTFTYIDLQVFVLRNYIVIYSGQTPSGVNADYRLVQVIRYTGGAGTDVSLPFGSDAGIVTPSGVKTLRQVVTTGNLNIGDVSDIINPTLREEIANASNFACGHYPKKGWAFLLLGDTVRIYDYTHKAWARMVGADVKGMFNTADGKLYLTGTGYLYEYGSGWTFAGNHPAMIWDTAWLPISKDGRPVYPKFAEIVTYPQDVTDISMDVAYDMNIPMTENRRVISTQPEAFMYCDNVTDCDAWEPLDPIPYSAVRAPLFGRGRSMQMTFSNISDKPVEISDIALQAAAGGF